MSLLFDAFAVAASAHPALPAVVDLGNSGALPRVTTYAALHAQVLRLSSVITSRLGTGAAVAMPPHLLVREPAAMPTIVGILGPASPSYVACVLAAAAVGAAFLPIGEDWPAARVGEVLDGARPAIVLGAAP
eukprot:CAMPEP_0182883180 /NCGR_PEP_ID=MMETSP0034_2-20130328/18236_1 /TAXON_ID=156128 /ORGANISM="Nephroselmis pyriformis, Strain CCMP717" /LENGTH=131 /DNA_ID=CAMNT_0025016313 /DNA_START=168 /DNA_END=559 /DNA_ORIENTATION=+